MYEINLGTKTPWCPGCNRLCIGKRCMQYYSCIERRYTDFLKMIVEVPPMNGVPSPDAFRIAIDDAIERGDEP